MVYNINLYMNKLYIKNIIEIRYCELEIQSIKLISIKKNILFILFTFFFIKSKK